MGIESGVSVVQRVSGSGTSEYGSRSLDELVESIATKCVLCWHARSKLLYLWVDGHQHIHQLHTNCAAVLHCPIQGLVPFHVPWLCPGLQALLKEGPTIRLEPQPPQGMSADHWRCLEEVIPPEVTEHLVLVDVPTMFNNLLSGGVLWVFVMMFLAFQWAWIKTSSLLNVYLMT